MFQAGTHLESVREQTPGCRSLIHFNNAGSSLVARPVLDAMLSHLALESRAGGYEAAEQECERIAAVYGSIGRLINAQPEEIALTESATKAWDLIFYSMKFAKGDRILTSSHEYVSNYIAFLQLEKRCGVSIEVIPNDEHGLLSLEALQKMIDPNVRLLALTHVPSNNGLVQPVAQAGRISRQAGVPFLLDACQSVGQMPVDVEEIGCDFLTATGRKYLRAPRGTGFLFVRRDMLNQIEPVFLDTHAVIWDGPDTYRLRPDARRFESWESGIAARMGLGAAADYALELGLSHTYKYIRELASYTRQALNNIKGVAVNDLGSEPCGIICFSMRGRAALEVRDQLRENGINVSCTSALSVLRHRQVFQSPSMVRASLHYYNTYTEADRFVNQISLMVKA